MVKVTNNNTYVNFKFKKYLIFMQEVWKEGWEIELYNLKQYSGLAQQECKTNLYEL